MIDYLKKANDAGCMRYIGNMSVGTEDDPIAGELMEDWKNSSPNEHVAGEDRARCVTWRYGAETKARRFAQPFPSLVPAKSRYFQERDMTQLSLASTAADKPVSSNFQGLP